MVPLSDNERKMLFRHSSAQTWIALNAEVVGKCAGGGARVAEVVAIGGKEVGVGWMSSRRGGRIDGRKAEVLPRQLTILRNGWHKAA